MGLFSGNQHHYWVSLLLLECKQNSRCRFLYNSLCKNFEQIHMDITISWENLDAVIDLIQPITFDLIHFIYWSNLLVSDNVPPFGLTWLAQWFHNPSSLLGWRFHNHFNAWVQKGHPDSHKGWLCPMKISYPLYVLIKRGHLNSPAQGTWLCLIMSSSTLCHTPQLFMVTCVLPPAT
jgi:hypothetical protein